MRVVLFFIFACVFSNAIAQIPTLQRQERPIGGGFGNQQDDAPDNNIADFERPPIEDYKIISIRKDTITVDTSLTIAKDYKFNYLRRDRYGLLPFANTGQTYNTLIYNFDRRTTTPTSVAQARHFNYMDADEITYFYLPTPVTELFYRSAFEQGQQLDASFSMNTSKRVNFSIGYKGLRSLGKYLNSLTSTGNFRAAFSYNTKNEKYFIKAHWVAQDLLNQENGGLTDQALEQFTGNDEEFNDREQLGVNVLDAENILDGTRVYVNHHFNLLSRKDSIRNYSLRVGHIFNSENKFYQYTQSVANDIFGQAFEQGAFRDRTDQEETYNELFATYEDDKLGTLTFQANALYYDYGYKTVIIVDQNDDGVNETIPNRLQGTNIAVGGRYANTIGKLDVEGEAQVNVVGDFDGYNIFGKIGYDITDDAHLSASILSNSRAAGYNHLLFQSNYVNYIWHNAPTYNNVKTNTLSGTLTSRKWANVDISASTITDFAYFGLSETDSLVTSKQSSESLNHLKITANREFTYGNFALDATVTLQNVSGAEGVLNVPDIVTRGSLYFSDRLFKRALLLQTGVTLNYFTEYNLNAYDPVLAEFFVQNEEQFGNFPLIDLFVNMKVRQTRIFIKAEHINSGFTGNNFFSAPGYPYRDFNIRFGLVWNFFL
jgi:hypothetical protein